MNSTKYQVFTIGHSSHSVEEFVELLKMHDVDMVADVRSIPRSRYAPQFNREGLEGVLKGAGIRYAFHGDRLGGRPEDRSLYDENGRVDFGLLANTDAFRNGIREIEEAADRHRVAVMCREKEPLKCHRTLLVARELEKRGMAADHILYDGTAEKRDDTMNRLLDYFGWPHDGDMIDTREHFISRGLDRMARKVAYVERESSWDGLRIAH